MKLWRQRNISETLQWVNNLDIKIKIDANLFNKVVINVEVKCLLMMR